jgi:hypothetical protein
MAKGTPTETGVDIVYALARGNGRLAWGSGCNGTPLVKYGTEVGNWWTSDIGKYDTRGSNVTQANFSNPQFRERALQNQSIACFLPSVGFDTFYKACAAEMAIWIGSPTFPKRERKNSSNLSQASSWTSGAHATCFVFGMEVDNKRYLLWSNQHGNRYSGGAGDRFGTPSDVTWTDENDFPKFRITKNYGTPFVHLGEIPSL